LLRFKAQLELYIQFVVNACFFSFVSTYLFVYLL